MGKTAQCIEMLQILNARNVVKISELADLLNTNPRNIIEYRKELEECNYIITSIPGRYGGYRLDQSYTIPSLRLTNNEKQCLVDSFNYCLSNDNFVHKDILVKSFSKVLSNNLIEVNKDNIKNINHVEFNVNTDRLEKNFTIIQNAINNKTTILVEYSFLKEGTKTIEINPYDLFLYDNEWRFFAWYSDKCEVWHFKISRIKNVKETEKKFRIWKGYKFENYLKNNVFTTNGELFKLKLIAYGVRGKLFKEKTYGRNQTLKDLNENAVEVSMEMQNNYSTYNFLLGCGDLIKIIEPIWLIDKIKSIAQEIINKY